MTSTKGIGTIVVLVALIVFLTAGNFSPSAVSAAVSPPPNSGCPNIKASGIEISQCSTSATCAEGALIAVCSDEAGIAVNDPGADGPRIVVKPHK